jgi:hypothetical protein
MNIMNNTFWLGAQQGLSKEMLDFVTEKFPALFGVNF